jgi:hypothetical protein
MISVIAACLQEKVAWRWGEKPRSISSLSCERCNSEVKDNVVLIGL